MRLPSQPSLVVAVTRSNRPSSTPRHSHIGFLSATDPVAPAPFSEGSVVLVVGALRHLVSPAVPSGSGSNFGGRTSIIRAPSLLSPPLLRRHVRPWWLTQADLYRQTLTSFVTLRWKVSERLMSFGLWRPHVNPAVIILRAPGVPLRGLSTPTGALIGVGVGPASGVGRQRGRERGRNSYR